MLTSSESWFTTHASLSLSTATATGSSPTARSATFTVRALEVDEIGGEGGARVEVTRGGGDSDRKDGDDEDGDEATHDRTSRCRVGESARPGRWLSHESRAAFYHARKGAVRSHPAAA